MSRRAAGTGTPRPSDLLIDDQHDLILLESPDEGGDGVFNADGTVNMVIVRPCNGLGPGKRIYEAAMLEREAPSFAGLSMFDNHDSPQAKKARGNMPRPVRDLAGAIRESWWDPDFVTARDAENGWGQGAVIGKCALTPTMRTIVESVPEAVRTSMHTLATAGKMGTRNGRRGFVVEGFVNDPTQHSVDLVTRAGAGGQVAAIIEAEVDAIVAEAAANGVDVDVDELPIEEALAEFSDAEIQTYLAEHRPQITTPEGGDMDVQEALQSPEVKAFIGDAITEGVANAIADARPQIEESVRDEIRQELAAPERLRRLHKRAVAIVAATKLPQAAKDAILAEYEVTEAGDSVVPARGLAVIEAVLADDGTVEQTDEQVLEAAVQADIRRQVDVLRATRPSVPYAPGSSEIIEGAGGEPPAGEFGGANSEFARMLKRRGADPALFGATKREAA